MIETKRLLIKPLSYDELKKYATSTDELAKELGLNPTGALVDEVTQNAIVNDLLPHLSDPEIDTLFYTMWIIIEKTKKVIVGGICFHGEPDANGEVEIGYGTDEAFQNKGYMTETLNGMIEWSQNNKKIKTLKAETDRTNISSIKVLERNRFKLFEQTGHSVIMKLELMKWVPS